MAVVTENVANTPWSIKTGHYVIGELITLSK